jgi:hypothetical protein
MGVIKNSSISYLMQAFLQTIQFGRQAEKVLNPVNMLSKQHALCALSQHAHQRQISL